MGVGVPAMHILALQAMTDCLVLLQLDLQLFMVRVVTVVVIRQTLVLHVVQDLVGIRQLIIVLVGLMRHFHLLMADKVQIWIIIVVVHFFFFFLVEALVLLVSQRVRVRVVYLRRHRMTMIFPHVLF